MFPGEPIRWVQTFTPAELKTKIAFGLVEVDPFVGRKNASDLGRVHTGEGLSLVVAR